MGRKEELLSIDERTEEEQRELDALIEAENPEKKTEEDEFDAAFDDAMNDVPQGETEDDEEGKKKEKDSDDGTTKPEDEDQETEEGLIKPPDEEDTDETNEDDEVDWKAEFAKVNQKMKSWDGRIRKANERAEKAEQKLEEALKKSTTDKDVDEDDTSPEGDDLDDAAEAIKEFTTEYPSLEKPIKAIAETMAKKIVDTKLKDLEPKIKELETRVETEDEVVMEDHFSTIREVHPDFEEIHASGKLQSWLDKQDSFVRYGFERVIAEGTADEIIDMFNRYKGVKATQSSQSTKREKAKAKAKQHMAVDGESGGPIDRKGKKDKDDFDGAWDEALATK
jgi:hypothetical protein